MKNLQHLHYQCKKYGKLTIDYVTGILALNVSEDHLNAISYTLDATSNAETDRPRISL